MSRIIICCFLIALSGCGAFDRLSANITGDASEVCHDGVLYLQFTSGTSVKYDRGGKVALCH